MRRTVQLETEDDRIISITVMPDPDEGAPAEEHTGLAGEEDQDQPGGSEAEIKAGDWKSLYAETRNAHVSRYCGLICVHEPPAYDTSKDMLLARFLAYRGAGLSEEAVLNLFSLEATYGFGAKEASA